MIGRVNGGIGDKRLPNKYELFALAYNESLHDTIKISNNFPVLPISVSPKRKLTYTDRYALRIEKVTISKVNESYVASEPTTICNIAGNHGTPYIFNNGYFKYDTQSQKFLSVNTINGAATLILTVLNNHTAFNEVAYDGEYVYILRNINSELCKLKVSNPTLTTIRNSTQSMSRLTYHDNYLYWVEGNTCYRMNTSTSQVESSAVKQMEPFVQDEKLWFLNNNIIYSDFNGQGEKYRIGALIHPHAKHKLDGQWIIGSGNSVKRVPFLIAEKI